jgi:cation transport ATPase
MMLTMANETTPQQPQALTLMRRLARARQQERRQEQQEQLQAAEAKQEDVRAAEQVRGAAQQRGMAETISRRSQRSETEGEQEHAEQQQQEAAQDAQAGQAEQAQRLQLSLIEQQEVEKESEVQQQATQARRLRMALLFFPLLILAASKDAFDIISLDALSWFDWVIDFLMGGLFFVVGWQSGGQGELRQTATLLRRITPMILEALPLIGFLPIWTISIIIMGMRSSQQQDEGRVGSIEKWARQRTRMRQREELRKAA